MTPKTPEISLFFHGTGSGGHPAMGASAATLERNRQPWLLIDCGPGTLAAFERVYNQLPDTLFMTHAHMDHIADLEILSVRIHLQQRDPVLLFVPLSILPTLHQRLATYPGTLAEGGHDFWRSFQLIPVTNEFLLNGYTFRIYPTRHHAPGSSYALHLPGRFLYTGDTRPIPEILHHHTNDTDIVFHDCGTHPNPSHTGLTDLDKEYQPDLLQRLVLYHYSDEIAGQQLAQAGYQVARPDQRFIVQATPERPTS